MSNRARVADSAFARRQMPSCRGHQILGGPGRVKAVPGKRADLVVELLAHDRPVASEASPLR